MKQNVRPFQGTFSKLAWGLIILTLTASGCGQSADPVVRLGTNVWPGYEPLYLADQLDYYPEDTVKLVEYLSASEVIRAFRNEALDAAALTLDEALLLQAQQVPIQVILVTDFSAGGDVIVAKPDVVAMKDLAGKRVGVEGNALGAYVISRAIEIHDVNLDSLEIVQLEVSEHEAAWLEDRIDAAVTFEPVRSKLLANGATEIFTSREIPGEIVDVIVVRSSFLENHPEQFTKIVDAWFRALDYLDKHPEDAAKRMSVRLNLEPAAVLDSYTGLQLPSREENKQLLGGTKPGIEQTIKQLQKVMLEKELLSAPVSTNALLTADFL